MNQQELRDAEKASLAERVVTITPTWRTQAGVALALLESGRGKGRDSGKRLVLEMAAKLDELNAAQENGRLVQVPETAEGNGVAVEVVDGTVVVEVVAACGGTVDRLVVGTVK